MSSLPCITLWQPFSSLIACGAKSIETRSWPPSHHLIGRRIAIHAAKKAGPFNLDAETATGIAKALGVGPGSWHTLPLGAVVATVKLEGAYQVQRWDRGCEIEFRRDAVAGSPQTCGISLAPPEHLFGDYRQGRWLWMLGDIEKVEPASPAKGAQGVWMWDPVRELAH